MVIYNVSLSEVKKELIEMTLKEYLNLAPKRSKAVKKIAMACGVQCQTVNKWSTGERTARVKYWKFIYEVTGGFVTPIDLARM
jgi:hypothetical protein